MFSGILASEFSTSAPPAFDHIHTWLWLSKPFCDPILAVFGVPPSLEPILVDGLGCSLGGTIWILTHGHIPNTAPSPCSLIPRSRRSRSRPSPAEAFPGLVGQAVEVHADLPAAQDLDHAHEGEDHPVPVHRFAIRQGPQRKDDRHLAVAQKTFTNMGCPIGKWKHGPKPAVCPSSAILSHTHLSGFGFFMPRESRGNASLGKPL